MTGLMVSGIIMSREVFGFLPISGGTGFARTLHMLASYWGFLFMSLHLGLHWGMMMRIFRRAAGIKAPSAVRTWLLRSRFVFFDMEQPLRMESFSRIPIPE